MQGWVYPQFCVNSKAGAKNKVNRGGGQGSLFAALTAMNQKSSNLWLLSSGYSVLYRRTMTLAYRGSSSIVRQMRSVCAQAMSVLPEPPNGSITTPFGAELFLIG